MPLTRAQARAVADVAALAADGPAAHWLPTSAACALLGMQRRSLSALGSRGVLEMRPVRFDPARHPDGRYDRVEYSVRSLDRYRHHAKPRPWQGHRRGEDLRMIHPRLTLSELALLDGYCQRHTLPRDRALALAIRLLVEQEDLPAAMRNA